MASFAETAPGTLEEAGLMATAPITQTGRVSTYEVGSTDADASEMARKKALMDARMARRNKSRADKDAARRAQAEENSDPNQTPEVFWTRFKDAQLPIQSALDEVTDALGVAREDTPSGQEPGAQFLSTATPAGRQAEKQAASEREANAAAVVAAADALPESRKTELLALLTPLSGQIDDLQKMAAGAAFYLPPYDIRSAATSVRKMRATLTMVKGLVQPKKKFSFKEKRAARKAAAAAKKAAKKAKKEAERLKKLAAAGATTADGEVADSDGSSTNSKPKEGADKPTSFLPTVVDYTVRGKKNETISVPPGALSEWASQEPGVSASSGSGVAVVETSKSRDVVLADLEDCVVFLGDTMSALRVDNLRRCHVYGVAREPT